MKLRNIVLLGLATLLAFGLVGCVSKPCIEKSGAVPATNPGIIEQFPVLRAADDEGDLNLINPLNAYSQDDVRELFGMGDFARLYRDYDIALVPKVFDVRAVNVSRSGERWRFVVNTFGVGDRESGFQPLVSSGQGRVAIYLDANLDNISDVILTTVVTEDGTVRMVAVTSEYQRLASGTDIEVQWDEAIHQLTVDVPASLVGQHYDWVLATGFAASADASCAAVSDERVRWVPTVDIVIPDCPHCPTGEERSISFYDSFQISSPCQIWKSTVTSCGASTMSSQPLVTLPGKPGQQGKQGWLFISYHCGQRKMELYCSNDWVGWVDNGTEAGWFAHCPYGGGINSQTELHTDSDVVPDGWIHTVKTPSGSNKVEYIYHFGPPYTYWIFLYSGTQVNKCKNLQLTDDPWSLPWSHCSNP